MQSHLLEMNAALSITNSLVSAQSCAKQKHVHSSSSPICKHDKVLEGQFQSWKDSSRLGRTVPDLPAEPAVTHANSRSFKA